MKNFGIKSRRDEFEDWLKELQELPPHGNTKPPYVPPSDLIMQNVMADFEARWGSDREMRAMAIILGTVSVLMLLLGANLAGWL